MTSSTPRIDLAELAGALFRETGDALVLFDPSTGAILDVNPTAQRLSGCTRDDLLAMQTTSLFKAEGKDSESRLQDAQQSSGSFHARDGFVIQSRSHIGGVPVNLTITRLHLEAGTFGLITARDVREQRDAYHRLKKVEAKMRRVLTSVSDCLWSARLDRSGTWTYRYFSPVVESITGRSPKHFMGDDGPIEELNWRHIVDPRDLDCWKRFVSRIQSGHSGQEEYRVLRPDGNVCWVRESVRISSAGDHRSLLIDGVIADVTVRKRTEAELEAAKDAAIAASRAKSEFLAHVSHEIRTPLNGILGMGELIQRSELTPVQRCYLDVLQGSARSLLAIINDVLDFSKIEARKLELETVPFSLRETLSDALSTLAINAQQNQIRMVLHVRPAVPDSLVGDPNRFRQVVLNLVNNAVKFTELGEIVVSVDEVVSNDAGCGDSATLHVSVRDSGIGIPTEKLELIFEAFAQVDPSSTRKYGGTGLGLGIATKLVQAMNGRIWAESEVGVGSTFHFEAQFKRGEEITPIQLLQQQYSRLLAGKRALVVEDHPASLWQISEILGSWGVETVALGNIESALAALQYAGESGAPFNAILVGGSLISSKDHLAPNDFWRLQPGGLGKNRIVLLLFGASNLERDSAICRNVGANALVSMPIRESVLIETLGTQLAPFAASADRPLPRNVQHFHRNTARVLLVEDNAVNQLFAATVLENHGHQVIVARSAAEAIMAVERESFDICLMDVEMPDMDGFAATKEIRRLGIEKCVTLPIVAVTAHALVGFREKCLEAGMNDYLSKPVSSEELLSVVSRLGCEREFSD